MAPLRTLLALIAAPLIAACGASLPGPPSPAAPPHRTFVEVPEPPPAARVEIVTPRPKEHGAVWVDGTWAWEGSRWKWEDGGWFVVPRGVFFADGAVQRQPDGTVLYANPAWVDARGTEVEAPKRLEPGPSAGKGQEVGS